MERGILRTFKPDGTPVEIYDADALTKAEFTTFGSFSEEEWSTGKKWIDGKSLYGRTFNTGVLPNNTTKYVSVDIGDTSKVVYLEGYGYNPIRNTVTLLPMVQVSSVIACGYNGVGHPQAEKSIFLQTNGDLSAFTESFITLYYTKDV